MATDPILTMHDVQRGGNKPPAEKPDTILTMSGMRKKKKRKRAAPEPIAEPVIMGTADAPEPEPEPEPPLSIHNLRKKG